MKDLLLLLMLGRFASYILPSEQATAWHYDKSRPDGPWDWEDECKGNRQSPIELWADDVVVDASIPELRFHGYDRYIYGLNIVNNGRTIKIPIPSEKAPSIAGGKLNGTYRLEQIHFHWGPILDVGSEHTFGNKHFPFEMHMVHIKEGLTLLDALHDEEGLAVLGMFFHLSAELDNPLTAITDHLEEIQFKDSSVDLGPMNLMSLLPADTGDFLTYHGSLTTPPCSEVVVWNLFTNSLPINAEQLDEFRDVNLKTKEELAQSPKSNRISNKMFANHRPIQPVNGRIISARSTTASLPRRAGA